MPEQTQPQNEPQPVDLPQDPLAEDYKAAIILATEHVAHFGHGLAAKRAGEILERIKSAAAPAPAPEEAKSPKKK